MCVLATACVHKHGNTQFTRAGSLPPPNLSWGLKSGHWAWQQVLLSAEPPCWLILVVVGLLEKWSLGQGLEIFLRHSIW